MHNYKKYILLLVVSICACNVSHAQATTTTTPLLVSATVLSVCGVLATPVVFGNYSQTSGTALTASGTVTATCTSGVAFTLSLDKGAGTGATVAQRVMMSGSNKLNYSLYTTSGYTTVWGDGTLSTVTQGATASLTPTIYTVYGSIPTGQQSPLGAYTDSVTVTLTY